MPRLPTLPQLLAIAAMLAYSGCAAALRRGVEVSAGAPVLSCGPGVRATYGDQSPPPARGQRSCSSYRQHLSQPDDRPALRSPDREPIGAYLHDQTCESNETPASTPYYAEPRKSSSCPFHPEFAAFFRGQVNPHQNPLQASHLNSATPAA